MKLPCCLPFRVVKKMNRFEKQILLEGFGITAQEKLLHAGVLVVGAGGLGCPVLQYLAAAGVGTLGIADGDTVMISNLNRQVLFGENDVDKNKAATAALQLTGQYRNMHVDVFPEWLNNQNIIPLIEKYDLIIDCTDNFAARYLINDACMLMKKPWIFGAIYRNEGQVALFNPQDDNSVCYRDLNPELPETDTIPDCNQSGVLGVLPGIIGTMMAAEAIKWITGYGQTLQGKILLFNLLNYRWFNAEILPVPGSKKNIPRNRKELLTRDYAVSCSPVPHFSWKEALKRVENNPEKNLFVDVRNADENSLPDNFTCLQIPLPELKSRSSELAHADHLFLFCRSGIRSLEAVKILKKIYPTKNICNIEGGVLHAEAPFNRYYHESQA